MVTWNYDDLPQHLKAQIDGQSNKPINIIEPPKKSKYGNVKVVVDGHTFASTKESDRYCELKWMLIKGEITELVLQPRFVLLPKFTDSMGEKHREIAYVADFEYLDHHGRDIVEDVKPSKTFTTAMYKLKKKLLLLKYPEITFREIT
jgi:hypothetical protein